MIKEDSSSKKIYDSVHGFIRYDDLEKAFIDSCAFQRLHYIHQMGVAYLVYPGATHTRFEHSLGVLELATRMYQRICENITCEYFDLIPRMGSHEYLYWKKILRLAALCHDLGHFPFSHVAEENIYGGKGHEYWTVKIIESPILKPLFSAFKEQIQLDEKLSKRDIVEDVIKVAIGEKRLNKIFPERKWNFSSFERILSQIITADFFGADRIDYLMRDSKFTGVAYGFFDYLQLIESLRVLPSENKSFELGIDESGLEACEALLLARYFMYKRVYFHPSIKAYGFHMKRAMEASPFFDRKNEDVSDFLKINDSHIICYLNEISQKKNHPSSEDAQKILLRKNRFKALFIPEEISVEKMEQFKKKFQLKEDQISWEFKESDLSKKDMSFPVHCKYGNIVSAKNISPILTNILSLPVRYVYLSPEFEQIFMQSILK
jgi:HD superfamily phosphohydrolase